MREEAPGLLAPSLIRTHAPLPDVSAGDVNIHRPHRTALKRADRRVGGAQLQFQYQGLVTLLEMSPALAPGPIDRRALILKLPQCTA